MHAYVCTCIHTYIKMLTISGMHPSTHTHMNTHTYIRVHIHTQIKTLTIGDEGTTCNLTLDRGGSTIHVECTRVFPNNVRDSYVHNQIRYAFAFACVCAFLYLYIHTYIHTYSAHLCSKTTFMTATCTTRSVIRSCIRDHVRVHVCACVCLRAGAEMHMWNAHVSSQAMP
jgi:hypothetical protein